MNESTVELYAKILELTIETNDLLRENTRLKAQLAQLTPIPPEEAGDDIPIEDIEESIRAAIADAENEEARYAN